MDRMHVTAGTEPAEVKHATPNGESAALVADPAETFEAMLARLTGGGEHEPGLTVLDDPPHSMPALEIAQELARLYPGRVRVRYGAPMDYYAVQEHKLVLSYAAPSPTAPLPGETAAAYLERRKSDGALPSGRETFRLCPHMPTLAEARALQAQDPEHVKIDFGNFNHAYILDVLNDALFLFPEALRDVAEVQP